MRAGHLVLAVAGAIDPEPLAAFVLDLEVIPHRDQLGVALPPLAKDAFGPVGAPDAAADAAPGEGHGRGIGKQRHGLDWFGIRQQTRGPWPVVGPSFATVGS